MAGTAHHPWVGGEERAGVEPGELRRLDAHLARLTTALGAARARTPAERLPAVLRALLGALDRDVEATWSLVAVCSASGDPRALARWSGAGALLGAALVAAGLPEAAARALADDAWDVVHEHLWLEAEPDLPGLLAPLLALAGLRGAGLGAVRGALAAARTAA